MFFNKFPFVRLALPFSLGIISFHYLGNAFAISHTVLFLLFVVYLVFWKLSSFRFNGVLSVLAMAMLFCFGVLRLQHHRLDSEDSHLLWQKGTLDSYRGVIVEEPVEKARSLNVRLDIDQVYANGAWKPVTGRVNLYLNKEKGHGLQYGDELLVEGMPQTTTAPANPGEFDFANYLVYNNIFHQHFAGEHFEKIRSTTPNWFMAQSIALRQACKKRLTTHIDDPEVRSVMLAIVLGIKNELDNDLQSAYSASGAMHVLAVSGLHVGIIYAIILLVFKKLRIDQRKGRWLIAAVSILMLWTYAFLTGLSPSVLRAVTMFSFIALARAMNRNGNIYNTLAASAFVLLWYDPYLIMSVGFQLSYLAVFGIVYLQPRFYNLFTVNNYLLDKVWAITCVSLAAQIATAPLSILYFHQFPTYFLISNLFIIPAAFAMLIMGLGMLVLSFIPVLGIALRWLIEFFVSLVNTLVFFVKDLPGSTLEGIRIDTAQTWLIYAVFIFAILLFYKKRFQYLLISFAMVCLFAVVQVTERSKFLKTGSFRLLDVSGNAVADFRYSRDSRLFADSLFHADSDKRRFHFEPGRLLSGSNLRPQDDKLSLMTREFMGNPVVCFKGETFLFLKKPLPQLSLKCEALNVDHVIISHNSVKDLQRITSTLVFDHLLIDSSNKSYLTRKLMEQAVAMNLNAKAIDQTGYFEKHWND